MCDQPFCNDVDGALSTSFQIQPEVVTAGFLLFPPQKLLQVLFTYRTGFIPKSYAYVGRFAFDSSVFLKNKRKRGELKARQWQSFLYFTCTTSFGHFVRS